MDKFKLVYKKETETSSTMQVRGMSWLLNQHFCNPSPKGRKREIEVGTISA